VRPEKAAVEIREAKLSDAHPIARLADQLGYASSASQIAQRLRIVLPSPDDAVFVAASPASGVVGWLHVAGRQLVMSDRDAQIEGLVVDEAWRRQGIGQQLVRAAEHWARERGHSSVRVRSNVVRGAAHHFYRSAGFVEAKQQAVYQRRLKEPCET
jgi:GNAT superfamily N-acetyltransferase